MFDSEEGKPINSEFFKEIKELFIGDQGTSMASKVQQYTNRTSLKYQLMHAVQPLLNEVIKFVPDEFKDEAERLLTTWYGQTEDQKEKICQM